MSRRQSNTGVDPILSIVVPTKDRYDTLLVLLAYILNWNRQDVSIVVHDNSTDSTPIESFLAKHGSDSRLIYEHNPQAMSMVENFNRALAKANGTYVCLLGDDDGLVESVVDFCKWMERNRIDSATFDRPQYDWPDLKTGAAPGEEVQSGQLIVPHCNGRLVEVDVPAELGRLLRAAVTNYKNMGPAPYNGLVAKRIFEITKSATGSYFPGTTPDMAASISAFLTVSRHLHVSIPLICGGQSFKSAAGMGRRGQHIGEVQDVRSLEANTSELWSAEIPKFWSGFTINAESALQTLRKWKRDDLAKSFNFNRTIAACLIYLPNAYRLRAWAHIGEASNEVNSIGYFGVIKGVFEVQLARARSLLKRKLRPANRSKHKTISEALDHLQERIDEDFPGASFMSGLDNITLARVSRDQNEE